MRLELVVALAVALVGAAASASPPDVRVAAGESATGDIVFDGEEDRVAVDLIAGMKLTFTAKPAKKSPLLCSADLLDPAQSVIAVDPKLRKESKGSVSLKTVPVAATGTYFVAVRGTAAGPLGVWDLLTSAKLAPKPPKVADTVPAAGSYNLLVDALAGSTLNVAVASAKGSSLRPRIASITGPHGETVDLASTAIKRRETTTLVSLSRVPLAAFGTWRIRVTGEGGSGGAFSATRSVSPPKTSPKTKRDLRGASGGEATAGDPASIEILPAGLAVAAGATQQCIAKGTYADGRARDLTRSVEWSVGNRGAATFSATAPGLLTGVAAGGTTAQAWIGRVEATESLVLVGGATVQSVDVLPAGVKLALGESAALQAVATLSAGGSNTGSVDVTRAATWAQTGAALSSVARGRAVATTIATSQVTAAVSSVTSAGQGVQVTGRRVVTIALSPTYAELTTLVTTRAFAATATYSDGTTATVTGACTFTCDNLAAATISGNTATRVASGTAGIRATLDGVTSRAAVVNVGPVGLSSVVVGGGTTVAVGGRRDLSATGSFSDGGTRDLTDAAVWSSNAPGTATVSTAAGTKGRVTGVALNATPAVITATVTVGGAPRAGTGSMTCGAAATLSVRIVPSITSAAVGGATAFRAFAARSDGTESDVTATATWGTSDATAATVAAGVVTGVADGGAAVSATFDGKTARAVVLSGTGRLVGIALSAPLAEATLGESAATSAVVTFAPAGASQSLITGIETSLSDDPLAVPFAGGSATSRRAGAAELRAAFGGVVSAPLSFTARAPVVRGLTTFPQAGFVSIVADAQMAAQARWSDGSVTDVASSAAWTSLSPSFITVNGTGLIHAVVKGTSTIRSQIASPALQSDASIQVAGDTPVVTSVTPTTLLRGTLGATLTLNGTALDGLNPSVSVSGTGVTVVAGPNVLGGGTQATVTVDVAAGAATGFRDVTYTTLVGSSTLTNAFQINVPAPTVTSLSPSNVDVPGAGSTQQLLTLTGTGFAVGDSFSLSAATGVSLGATTVVNSTTMTATVTVDSVATKSRLNVTAAQSLANGGASATLTNAFKVGPADPTITSVAPAFVYPGQGAAQTVTVTGTNFQSGVLIEFPDISGTNATATSVTRASTTSITFLFTVPANATPASLDIRLTNTGDISSTFSDVFAIAARDPTIASFSAKAFAQGVSNVAVTLKGTNFRSGDTLAASGSGVSFSTVTIVDPETITAKAAVQAGAAIGARSITVAHSAANGGRSATRPAAFSVVGGSPTVTSLSPGKVGRTGSGGATRRVPITITGTNFSEGATVSLALSGGSGVTVAGGTTAVLSGTSMAFAADVTGTATTGLWDVTVTNPSSVGNSGTTGNGKLEIALETTLVVNLVSPAAGSAFGGERVTIQGAGFARGCRVEFGTEKAQGVQFLDQNTLVATVPSPASPATSGASSVSTTVATSVDVKVTNNPGGSATSATLTGGWAYGADAGPFRILASVPIESSTTSPLNLKSVALRLSAPANTNTAVIGATRGTHCYWFLSGSFSVSGQTVGFGADPRFLVFSRTSGGNLGAASANYVIEIPTALKSSSGRAMTPTILAAGGNFDQWFITLNSLGTTDTAAPTVASTFPTASATGVGTAIAPSVTFNEPVDPLTITSSSVQLKQGSTVINCVVRLSDDIQSVTLTPTEELAKNTQYTISLGGTIGDLCGNTLTASTQTFTTQATDTTAPTIDTAVLASLPTSVDGSGTYVNTSGSGGNAFDAYLPTYGWPLAVTFSDAGDGIDASTFSAKANCAVGSLSANAELASKFTITSTGATWTVGSADAFAAQDNATLTFSVRDKAGNTSTSTVLTFDTIGIDSTATGGPFTSGGDHDPFDTRETWVLRFDVDTYAATFSTTGTAPTATQQCTTTGSSNGTPDYEEALRLCGLQSAAMTTGSAAAVNGSTVGTNAIVARLFQERLRASLRTRFGIASDGTRDAGSANIEFVVPGELGSLASAPTLSTTVTATSSNAYSEMDIGGDTGPNSSATGTYGTLGIAYFDLRNMYREVNLNTALPAGNNNGIFCINMFKALANVSRTGTDWGVAVTARFLTAKGGTPVGEGTSDHIVLAGSFDRTSGSNTVAENDRYDRIMDAIELAAMSVSGVTAHEIGHSVGLVPDASPKTGFFGNAYYTNTFTDATVSAPNTTHHLNFVGNDVMGPSSSVDDRTATGTDAMRFNPMDMNYLLHRQVHDEGK
ncbi:MAG: Ig-like domain-containing protein [Planctomycetes bacterium]|nr:Ig-like domain-containing protein [Planctomycetota bacterium]